MAIEAFPLTWPEGWKRTARRQEGPFQCTLGKARDGLLKQIKMLGGKHTILSTNLMLRLDGLPYATQRQPTDPGVAVYFDFKSSQMCFACDRYTKIEHNIRAIEKTIEALRGIERWGASDMMERAFTGFAQLEHKPVMTWWEVLGVPANASRDVIELSYKRLRSRHHPDHTQGDGDAFHLIQCAYEKAMENFQ